MPAKVHRTPSFFHILVLFFFVISAVFPNGRHVEAQSPVPIVAISAGRGHTDAIRADGTLTTLSGAPTVFSPTSGAFTQVSAGSIHDCGVRTDGTLACWGYNDDGRATPPEGTFTRVSSFDGNCAIRTDGSLACWGPSQYGVVSPSPEDLTYSYSQVSVGEVHSCGLTTGGDVRCWGYNGYGQTAAPVGSFIQVDVDMHSSCGIRAGGSLACWGYEIPGPIPDGTFTQIAVRSGADACALRTDGTLACWGSDTYNNGFVPPAGTFVQVTAGAGHTCALKADGSGTCWGRHDFGHEGGPFPPIDLAISSPSGTEFSLGWTDLSIDEADFRVERSTDGSYWTRIATLAANATGYTDQGLPPNTTYHYRVQACRVSDGDCSTFSNAVSSTTAAEQQDETEPSNTWSVALGDLNGDGTLDAYLGNTSRASHQPGLDAGNTVWFNDGTGHFTDSGQRLGVEATEAVALADLDGDGDLDAWDANGGPDQIWLNEGTGVLTLHQTLLNGNSWAVDLGDLDADGDIDAFIGSMGANEVWFNNGSGTFSDSGQRLGNGQVREVQLADLDGDLDLDAFDISHFGGGNRVWINDGAGHFTDSGQVLGTSNSVSMALGDLNGDTFIDAFVGSTNEPSHIYLNDGSGVFAESEPIDTGNASEGVDLGDVNGDGFLDVYVANCFGGDDQIWLNDGHANFTLSGQLLDPGWGMDVALGNLDGVAGLDAFVGNGGADTVWLNDGAGNLADTGQRLGGADLPLMTPNPPGISASLTTGAVRLYGFPAGAIIDLGILPPDGGSSPFHGAFTLDGKGEITIPRSELGLALTPGTVLQAMYMGGSDAGGITKELILESFSIDGIDYTADRVWGTAPADAAIHVYVSGPNFGLDRPVQVNPDGTWQVEFSASGINLAPDVTWVSARVYDADNDATDTDPIQKPYIEASLTNNWIELVNFPPETLVDISIAPFAGADPAITLSRATDANGKLWIDPNELNQNLTPGISIQADDAAFTVHKELVLADLTVQPVDADADQVRGTAEPGTEVIAGVGWQDGGRAIAAFAGPDGAWTADFRQDGLDLTPGMSSGARIFDADGDVTYTDPAPVPSLEVCVWDCSWIKGNNFTPNSPVTLLVDGQGIPLVGPQDVMTDPWGNFSVDRGWLQVVLQPGMLVQATDTVTGTVKSVLLANISIERVDWDAESVSGTSPVYAHLAVGAGNPQGNVQVEVDADIDGRWSADFMTAGWDLVNDQNNWLTASLYDEDGDRTSANPQPPIHIDASIKNDWINIYGLVPHGQVTGSIDGQPFNLAADAGGNLNINRDMHNVDLVPGTPIQALDVSTGRQQLLVLEDLQITNVNYTTDTISGTAPGSRLVHVEIGNQDRYWLEVLTNPDGTWLADFSTVPADLTTDMWINARLADASGNYTIVEPAPNPVVQGALVYDWIELQNFPAFSLVNVEVLPAGGGVPLLSQAFRLDMSGYLQVSRPQHHVDLIPEMILHAWVDGTSVDKWLTLENVSVTETDLVNDAAYGTADPGSLVVVTMHRGNTGGIGNDNVTAGSDGSWTASFSQYGIDVIEGDWAGARIYDEDGDATFAEPPRRPTIEGRLSEDGINFNNFTPAGMVNLSIYDPDGTLAYGPAPFSIDENGNGWFNGRDYNLDIQPGSRIVTGGGDPNDSKDVTLQLITLDQIDAAHDILTGTAPDGTLVHIGYLCDPGWCAIRNVLAVNGVWTADFSVSVPDPTDPAEQNTFDIRDGTGSEIYGFDADGNRTAISWQYRQPSFSARLVENQVHGYGWPLGSTVTLTIEDPGTPVSPDYTANAQTIVADWDPNQTFTQFILGDFILKPGQTVTLTDGQVTRSHEVLDVNVTTIDIQNDFLSGTAPAGSHVEVGHLCDQFGCAIRRVTADENGIWITDFAHPGANPDDPDEQYLLDIQPGMQNEVRAYGDDGITTNLPWQARNNRISVKLDSNEVQGYDWPEGVPVTLTINGVPLGEAVPSFQPWQSDTFVQFRLENTHQLQPGDVVTLTNGELTKTVQVLNLVVTGADPVTDRVSGMAPSGSTVEVGHLCGQFGCAIRRVLTNEYGGWTADFSLASGSGGNDEQMVFDIQPGTGNEARILDEDGDDTSRWWQVPYPPNITAFPDRNVVDGDNWPLNRGVTVTIDDSSTPEVEALQWTGQPFPPEWNPSGTWVDISLDDYDLKPGDTITMTNGVSTKTLVVAGFNITGIDIENDIISGITEGSDRWVHAWIDNIPDGIHRYGLSESDGTWQLNFAIEGGSNPEEQRTHDIAPGDWGQASTRDEDGDVTQVVWHAENPFIIAYPMEDAVWVQDWPVGSTVTLTVDDGSTPINENFTKDAIVEYSIMHGYGAVRFDFPEFDMDGGDTLTVEGGGFTRTIHVANLTAVPDSEVNILTVTADPGRSVFAWVDTPNGWSNRTITSDQNGVYVADFSVDEGRSDGFAVDLTYRSAGWVAFDDANGEGQTQISWRVPDLPVIVAFPDKDSVGGDNWPLGRDVTLTIDDGSTPQVEARRWVTQAGPRPWAPDGTWIEFQLNEYDLKTGDVLTMTDGVTTKTAVVTGLIVSNIDVDSDILTGDTDPGLRVQAWIDGAPEWIERNTFAQDGTWQLNFSASGGENPGEQVLFDIRPGTWGSIKDYDSDGDSTQVNWHVISPTIVAYPLENAIVAEDWPVGSTVTLTIVDGSTPEPEDFTRQALVEFNLWYGYGIARFDLSDFDLDAHDIVTVETADISRTIEIANLTAHPNIETDTIVGQADPGTSVLAWVNTPNGWTTRSVTADENGSYVANFSAGEPRDDGFAIDITYGSSGEVAVGEMFGGGQTRVSWSANISLHAVPAHPEVHGHNWLLGDVVTLTIDDNTDPDDGILYTDTKEAGVDDWCGQPCFDLQPAGLVLEIGQYVTMSDGVFTKTVLVAGLHVTEIDYVNDRLTGIADPGSRVAVNIWSQGGTARYVTADQDGNWVADFSVLGDEDFEQTTADLVNGDNGRALQLNPGNDNDDGTLEYWTVVVPPLCAPGDSVTGAVAKTGASRTADTDPFAPVQVVFVDPATGQELFQTGVTEDGAYGCALPAGTYTAYAVSDGYSKDYYNDAFKETASPFTVIEGQSLTGISFNLDTPLGVYDHLDFNFDNAALAELSVRQAIAHAVNRELLIAQTFPYSPVPDSIIPPTSPLYPSSGLPEYDYNPVQAANLLEAAGWVDTDGDGAREKNGQELRFSLVTTDVPVRHTLADRVRADLAAVGIVVENRFYERDNLFTNIIPSGDYDLTIFGWVSDASDEYIGYTFRKYAPGSQNFGRYDNPAADALLDQADGAATYAERIALWQQHQVVLMNDLATLPLVWRVVVDTDLDGLLDLQDTCPGDPSNQCSTETSVSQPVAEDGGTLVTPDQQVEMVVPEGALEVTTSLSITEMGGNFEVASFQGQMLAENSYSIEPHGTVFAEPVTITFTWDDADNNGIVDGTNLLESNLLVIKNNLVITPACAVYSGCDPVNNRISVEVTSLSLFVLGVPKVNVELEAGGPYSGVEGQAVSLTGSLTAGTAAGFVWDLDEDGDFDDASGLAPEVTFADNGTYTIVLRATTADGSYQIDTAEVTIANAGPVLAAISAPLAPQPIGSPVSATANFTDGGSADTHAAQWDWGDGTVTNEAVAAGSHTAAGSHVYTTPGVYVLALTLTDDDGGSAAASFRYVVVYDPNGGFVTGGGWITSPAGAYAANPDLVGKATFGFVSKYLKGATVPSGVTEFEFKVAGLNFHSESYDWLVVAGAKGQFKGVGTINGAGNYGFMLTAIDGDLNGRPDKFRIKIWDRATGVVVYDNQMGGGDTAEPTTVIGGGSIVIHQ